MRLDFGADRELVDRLGGSEGGWSFWTAALAALELAVESSRERRHGFCHYPAGELRRLLRDVGDALELAVTAAGVQDLINGDDEEGKTKSRQEGVDALLVERARAAGVTGSGNKRLPPRGRRR